MTTKKVKRELLKSLPPLTHDQAVALVQVQGGADIYDYALAGALRRLQKSHACLINICKPMQYTGDGSDRMPYFGCILTEEGREFLTDWLYEEQK